MVKKLDRVMYLHRTDNCRAGYMGDISSFHYHGRETRWDTTGFPITCCCSDCCGSACSCIGCGSEVDPRRTRQHARPPHPSKNAPRSPHPLPDSFTNHCVQHVNTPWHPACKPPVRRHPWSPSHGDADARSIHGISSVPPTIALTTAGWAGATSAPMGILG